MRKFVKYIATFLLVFVVAMATTITFLSPKDYGANMLGADVSGASASAVVPKLLTYFQSLNSFEVSAQINVDAGKVEEGEESSNTIGAVSATGIEAEPDFSFDVKADISSLSSPKLEAHICYNNGLSVDAKVVFDGSNLYLSINGQNFAIYHETIEEAVTLVLGLVSGGGFSAESLIESFDVGAIMGALNAMKETENEETGLITSTLNLPSLGSVDIITDNEYNLKSLRIYALEIIDLPLEAVIEIDKKESVEISAPENTDEYFDITSFKSAVLNTISLQSFTISPSVTIETNNYCKTLNFNVINDSTTGLKEINVNSDGNFKASLANLNQEYLLNLNNISLKIGQTTIDDALDFLSKKTINKQSVAEDFKTFATDYLQGQQASDLKTTIINKLKEVDIKEVLLSLTNFSANNGKIEFTLNLSKISALNLNALVNVCIEEQDGIISSIKISSVYGSEIDIDASIKISGEILGSQITQNSYFDVSELVNKLSELKNLKAGAVSANFILSNGSQNYNVNTKLVLDSINNSASLKLLSMGSLNKDLLLVYKNNNLFAKTGDIKLQLGTADICDLLNMANIDYEAIVDLYSSKAQEMVDALLGTIETFETPKIDFEQLLSFACANYSEAVNSAATIYELSKNLEISDGRIYAKLDKNILGTNNDLEINITIEENSLTISVSQIDIAGYTFAGSLELNTADNTIEQINQQEYLNPIDLVKKLAKLKDARSGQISLNATILEDGAVWQTINADVLADYINTYYNISATLQGQYNYAVSLVLDETLVYAKLNNIAVRFNYLTALDLLKEFDIDVFAQLNNLYNPQELESLLFNARAQASQTSTEDLLYYALAIKELKIDAEELFVKIDGSIFGVDGDLIFRFTTNEDVYSISVENLPVLDKTISAKLTLEEKAIEKTFISQNSYLDIFATIKELETLKDITAGTVSSRATIYENNAPMQTLSINSAFDINEAYAYLKAALFGKLNKNIELCLDNGDVFAKYNGLNIAFNIDKVEEILSSFGINTEAVVNNAKENVQNVKTDNVLNTIKEYLNKFGVNDYLLTTALENIKAKTIEDVVEALVGIKVSGNQIKLELDGSLLGQEKNIKITIWLLNNNYISFAIENLKISENEYLDAEFSLDYSAITKPEIDASAYLDIVSVYENALALKDARSGEININAVVMEGADVWQTIEANIKLDVRDLTNAYASIVANLAGEYTYSGSLIVDENNIYAKLENIAIKLNTQKLIDILAGFGIDANKIIGETLAGINIEGKLEDLKGCANNVDIKALILASLGYIKTYSANANEIEVKLDAAAFGGIGTASITIKIENNTICGIKLENIKLAEKTIYADIDFVEKAIEKAEINEGDYLDIYEVYNNALALKDARSGEININAVVMEGADIWQTIDANIKIDVCDLADIYAKVVANLEGQYEYSGNIVVNGKDVYAKLGDIAVKLNIESMLEILASYGIDARAIINEYASAIDVEAIKAELENKVAGANISAMLPAIVASVKSYAINANEISFVLDGSTLNQADNITITICLTSGAINRIKVEGFVVEGKIVYVDVEFAEKEIEREILNAAEFLDVNAVYENTIKLKDARSGEININATILEDNSVWQVADINIKADYSQLYAQIVANLSGEYNYNASLIFDAFNIYAKLNESGIKLNIIEALSVLGDFGIDAKALIENYGELLDVGALIEKLKQQVNTQDIALMAQNALNHIKSIVVCGSAIKATIDGALLGQEGDINITIGINDGVINCIKLENVCMLGKTIFADIMFEEKQIEKAEINEGDYLDIYEVYNNALALKDARSGEININAVVMEGADIWQTIDANIKIDVCDLADIYAKVVANLEGQYEYSGNVVVNGKDVYAKLGDIAVKLNIESMLEILASYGIDVKALVSEYIEQLDINGKKAELASGATEIDITALAQNYIGYINSYSISATEISVVIDAAAFGKAGSTSITIKIANNTICGIKLENVTIAGKTIYADIDFAEKLINKETPSASEYLDLTTIYEENIALKDARSGEVNISVVAEDNSHNICESLELNAIVDYVANYYAICGTIAGSYNDSIFAVYDNGTLYAKYSGAQIKVNIDDALEFLDKIGINTDDLFNSDSEFNFDDLLEDLENYNISTALIREIKGKLENINLEDKSNLVKDFDISANTIMVVLGGQIINQETDVVLTISLENNKLKELKAENIVIDGKVVKIIVSLEKIGETERAEITESDYTDIVSILDNLYSLKDLTNLSASFSGVLTEGSNQKYGLVGSIKLKTSETEYETLEERIINFVNSSYLSISGTLGGEVELNANIDLFNETLYIHLNETYIKITRQDLYELVGIPTSSKAESDAFILDKINGYGISDKLNDLFSGEEDVSINAQDLYNKLKDITLETTSTKIKAIIKGHILNQEKDLSIIANISGNKVASIEVENLKLDDITYISFSVSLDAETEQVASAPDNADNYFDLTTGYNNILDTLSLPAAQVSTSVGIYNTARTNMEEKTISSANGYLQTANISMQKISSSANKTLDLHGNVSLYGLLNNATLEAYYKNNVLYITYRSNQGDQALSFKINKSNIRNTVLEICGLLMSDEDVDKIAEGLDSAEDFMEGAGLDTIVDLSDMQLINLISSLTSGEQEQTTPSKTYTLSEIVDLLNGITMNKNGLSILIPASLLDAESDMKIIADYDATKITRLAVVGLDANLFADGVDLSMLDLDLTNKFIDINLNIVQSCASVASPSGTYIDLNGIDTLVKGASKAFKENKGFMLSGKISMKLLNMNVSWLTDTDVDVVVKINYTEADGLELYIELNNIPTTILVFNGYNSITAWTTKNTKIYYKNDRVYITRTNTRKPLIGSTKTSTIKYSMTPEWCFEHIDTVLGYALDFNSTIQKKITESLNSTDENAPACVIENILKSFSCSTSGTTGTYNLTVSGAALAQDTMIGDMGLVIKMNTSTLKINSIGISMAFVSVLDLEGTLNLTTYTNKQSISFSTSGYTFKG